MLNVKYLLLLSFLTVSQFYNLGHIQGIISRRACGYVDMGTCPHQILAATLTLSQPGEQIMPTIYTGVRIKFWKPQARLCRSYGSCLKKVIPAPTTLQNTAIARHILTTRQKIR